MYIIFVLVSCSIRPLLHGGTRKIGKGLIAQLWLESVPIRDQNPQYYMKVLHSRGNRLGNGGISPGNISETVGPPAKSVHTESNHRWPVRPVPFFDRNWFHRVELNYFLFYNKNNNNNRCVCVLLNIPVIFFIHSCSSRCFARTNEITF